MFVCDVHVQGTIQGNVDEHAILWVYNSNVKESQGELNHQCMHVP